MAEGNWLPWKEQKVDIRPTPGEDLFRKPYAQKRAAPLFPPPLSRSDTHPGAAAAKLLLLRLYHAFGEEI